MLKTEQNTPEMHEDVKAAADAILGGTDHTTRVNFEHGQWWATCNCGAAWSVVDAEGGDSVEGLDLELVSEGDEDYHQ